MKHAYGLTTNDQGERVFTAHDEETERLFLAAPAMYKALEAVRQNFTGEYQLLKQIEQAIAQAKGEAK